MSLVNDMLRDLDRRKSGGSAESVRVLHPNFNEAPSRKSSLPFFGVIAAVGVIVGLLGGFLYFGGSDQEAPILYTVIAQQAAPTNAEPEGAMAEPVIQRVQSNSSVLNSLESTVQNNEVSLVLNFSKEVEYSVSNPEAGVLSLLFKNSILKTSINTSVPGNLAELGLRVVEDGLKLNIETADISPFDIQQVDSQEGFGLLVKIRVSRNENSEPDAEGNADVSLAGNSAERLQQSDQKEVTEQQGEIENVSVTAPPVRTVRALSFEDQDNNISQRSIGLAQRGQILEAYRSLLEFIEANPQGHKARETLATLLIAQGENQQADMLLQQGLEIAPNNSAFVRLKARLMVAEGDRSGALTLLEQRPPLLSLDQEYHDLMSSLNQQLGNHDKAVQGYQNLLRSNPEEGRWWVAMGISHEAQGNVNEAVGSFRTALQMQGLDNGLKQYSQSRIQVLNQ